MQVSFKTVPYCLLLAVITIFGFNGCDGIALSHFDQTSCQILTELKPRVEFLYASFVRDSVDNAAFH